MIAKAMTLLRISELIDQFVHAKNLILGKEEKTNVILS
jgi:hypothetical protein